MSLLLRPLESFLSDTRLEGEYVEIIRRENGSDLAGIFSRPLDKHRIRREFTNLGAPQQNGSAERTFDIFT